MKPWRLLVGCLAIAAAAPRAAPAAMPTSIYVMNVDGSNVRKLIEVEGYTYHRAPRWSPDGKYIAFTAYSTAPGGLRECFVVGADGKDLRKMGRGDMPGWSPDSQQIVYQESASGSLPGVSVQNRDGQGVVQITDGISPCWSPDGSRIAVATANNVRLIDLDTGNERVLIGADLYGVFTGMDWSPDGKRLAVVVQPQKEGLRALLLLDPDQEKQPFEPRLRNSMGGPISFSPDGKLLTYAVGYKIHVLDLDSKEMAKRLPGQKGRNMHPEFSPDGKSIVFASDRDAPQQ